MVLLQLEAVCCVLMDCDICVVVDKLEEVCFPARDLRNLDVGNSQRLDEIFVPDGLIEGEFGGNYECGEQRGLPVGKG